MSRFVSNSIAKMAPALMAAFCLSASVWVVADYYQGSKFGTDFAVYWRTANLPLHKTYAPHWRWPFPYMPTMLLWITPLKFANLLQAYLLWLALSGTVFYLACRHYLSATGAVLALIYPPVVKGLLTGQVVAVIASIILWSGRTSNRLAAGVGFGVVASIKPQLVIMAPLMLLLRRDWQAIVAAGATFVILVLVSVPLFGADRWSEWLGSMAHFHHAVVDTSVITGGASPAIAALRWGLPPLPFLLLGIAGGAWLVWHCRDRSDLERTSAMIAGSLLASPYAISYDLGLLAPFLACSVMNGRILPVLGVTTPHPIPLAVAVLTLARASWLRVSIRIRNLRAV